MCPIGIPTQVVFVLSERCTGELSERRTLVITQLSPTIGSAWYFVPRPGMVFTVQDGANLRDQATMFTQQVDTLMRLIAAITGAFRSFRALETGDRTAPQ